MSRLAHRVDAKGDHNHNADSGAGYGPGGPPLKPADVPYWKITVNPPAGNGIPAALEETWYPENVESLRNALITVDGARVTFEAGLDYIAHE